MVLVLYLRVDSEEVVKIADFGLARDIYEKDYYAVEDRRRPMPIKWMAPECLDTFKFDSRSDVVTRRILSAFNQTLHVHVHTCRFRQRI